MASIAARFQAAMAAVDEPGLSGPELLPVRLARGCAAMLPVAGAGLSILDAAEQRPIPLGASDEDAECAERLQFTAGSGPCTQTQNSRQPTFATEEDMRHRWPGFAALLLAHTPFRAVVALPLQPALVGSGAMDLYFRSSEQVVGLDVFEALAVGELVGSALSTATVWSTWSQDRGPDWLQGPASRRRAAVWEALGTMAVQLELGAPAALELLRATAHRTGRTVDDVAADLLSGALSSRDLTTDAG